MWMVTAAMKLKDAWLLGRKAMTNLDNCIKIQRHYFAYRCLSSQSCGFSNSHVQMSELYPKEGWAPKNSCFWTVVLEKTLESSLDSKEIKPVNSKGNKSWIFIGRTNAEAEAQYFCHLTQRADSKRPWCWERWKVGAEGDNRGWDGWMASLTQWTWVWGSGVDDGQLPCWCPWGLKESDTTELMNWVHCYSVKMFMIFFFILLKKWD